MAGEQALVLGGGGVAGIAWMTGLLAGLSDAGQDITGAAMIIGTSAGANVAAQIGSGLDLDELFARQTEPGLQAAEIAAELDLETPFGLSAPVESPMPLQDVVTRLREGGAQVTVIEPDQGVGRRAGGQPA